MITTIFITLNLTHALPKSVSIFHINYIFIALQLPHFMVCLRTQDMIWAISFLISWTLYRNMKRQFCAKCSSNINSRQIRTFICCANMHCHFWRHINRIQIDHDTHMFKYHVGSLWENVKWNYCLLSKYTLFVCRSILATGLAVVTSSFIDMHYIYI